MATASVPSGTIMAVHLQKYSHISWSYIGEETGVHGENHLPGVIHGKTLSHNAISSTPRHGWDSNSQH